MVCPHWASLLFYSVFLTALWYDMDGGTTTNTPYSRLPDFPQRFFFWQLLYLLAFLGLSETWLKALVYFSPSPFLFCLTSLSKSNFLILDSSPPYRDSASFSLEFGFVLFFFFPLFQVVSSLGDQTSVSMLTGRLTLVFHSLNLNSSTAVGFQFFYWLPELLSLVSTVFPHPSVTSCFSSLHFILSCLTSTWMNFSLLACSLFCFFLYQEVFYPDPSRFLSCDVFYCFISDCSQCVPSYPPYFFLFWLCCYHLVIWFAVTTQ